jgi:hypothetical protein
LQQARAEILRTAADFMEPCSRMNVDAGRPLNRSGCAHGRRDAVVRGAMVLHHREWNQQRTIDAGAVRDAEQVTAVLPPAVPRDSRCAWAS